MEMFIYFLPALLVTIILTKITLHCFRSVKKRRAEAQRKAAIKKSAVVETKCLVEKIKFASHSRASQKDKCAAKGRMQNVEELIKRFDLDYLMDLGINEITLRKHVHMATVNEHEARKKLDLIRQGKFGFTGKSNASQSLPHNVIRLHHHRTPKPGANNDNAQRARAKNGTDCEDD